MTNLIIDGNYFLMRGLGALQLTFLDNPKEDRKELLTGYAIQLSTIVNTFESRVSNITFVFDDSSWRKETIVIKPKELEDGNPYSYKENRDKSTDTERDWKEAYTCFDEFRQVIKELGMPVFKAKGAEGDDMLYILSKVYKMKKIKSILWTSDGDMDHILDDYVCKFQSTTADDSGLMGKLKVTKEVLDMIKPVSGVAGFMRDTSNDGLIIIAESCKEKIEVDTYYSLLHSIVYGKKKDNVPPLFEWYTITKTNKHKCNRPTNTQIKKVFKDFDKEGFEYGTVDDLYNDIFIDKFVDGIIKASKQERDLEHTKKVFISNRKLCYLDKKEIPQSVQDNCIESIRENINKLCIFENFNKPDVIEETLNLSLHTNIF